MIVNTTRPLPQIDHDRVAREERTRVISARSGEDRISRAFNSGSDARLRGQPFNSCPHDPLMWPYEARSWSNGWLDVHKFWGKWANPSRLVPLPRVA